MSRKCKVLCALLCLTALIVAVSSEAAVSVKGKNLDNIEDIVSTATGSMANLRKYSLGIFNYIEEGSPSTIQGKVSQAQRTEFALRQIKEDGTAGTVTFDGRFTNSYGGGHGSSGREAAVSTITGKNGKAVLWVDYNHDYGNSKLLVYPQAAFITSKDSKFSISGETPKLELSVKANAKDGNDSKTTYTNSYMQNVKGGIFLPNDSKEYFALSFTKNTQLGKSKGTGASLTPYCSATVFIVGMEISGDKVTLSDTKLIIEQHVQQEYSPASIAIGDFTGTGTANEIAMTMADKDGIYLSVFRLANNNGTYSTTKVVEREKVCTYTGQMKTGYVEDINKFPVSETLAGDFDGDGKTEIAVVYKDDVEDAGDTQYAYGKINVSIYKWNNGAFKKENAGTSYNYFSASHFGGTSATRIYILGLRAAKADLDGDGKDEIAVLLIATDDYFSQDSGYYSTVFKIYPYLSRWYCDQGTITPKYDSGSLKGRGITNGALKNSSGSILFGYSDGVFYYKNTHTPYGQDIGTQGESLGVRYNYVQRAFSITAAPLTGTLGKMKTVDDIAVSWSGNSDREANSAEGCNQHVYVFRTNLSNGNFSSFGDAKQVFRSTTLETKTAVVAADFIGEGVELETPVHLKVEGERTYAAILQTPPYHIDYIPVPWESDQTPKLTNFTYAAALKSTYSHKTEGTTAQDVKFDLKTSVEEIEALSLDAGATGAVKAIAGFALGKAGVKDSDKILDALLDKVDMTKNETDKTSHKTVMSTQMETSASDRVLFYTMAVHVWRYPIKNPAPSWLFDSLIEGSRAENGEKFLTFTIADEPVINSAAGLEDDSYQPLHEEGNLFSYPTSLAQIEGYTNKQLVLTQPSNIVYSPGSHTQTITVTNDASKSTTEGRTVKYGTISKNINTVKVLTGKSTAASEVGERGNTSTFTKSYSTTDTLTASFPNPQGDYANVTFSTNVQAYTDEAGIMTLGFAVSDFGSTAMLWRNSVYRQKSDPALYMPYRYSIGSDAKVQIRTDEATASKIQGIRFFDVNAGTYAGNVLEATRKYRIDVPIYNASFVAPASDVELSLGYRDEGKTDVTAIGKTSVKIGGWQTGTTSNKAMAQIEWTVPEELIGQKELVVFIDPDNKIDEIHENWSKDVPGGNNSGYFKFSVISVTGLNAGEGEDSKASDFEITIDGMSMSDFIGYAAKKTEVFDAEVKLTSRYIENQLISTFILSMIDSDDNEIDSISRNVGVLNTGETYTFSFAADPEDWKNCNELHAVLYTDDGTVSISELRSTTDDGGNESPNDNKDEEQHVSPRGPGGSSGGCDSGFTLPGLILALSILIHKRKAR